MLQNFKRQRELISSALNQKFNADFSAMCDNDRIRSIAEKEVHGMMKNCGTDSSMQNKEDSERNIFCVSAAYET